MGFHGDFLRSKALLGDYTTQYIGDYHRHYGNHCQAEKKGTAEGFEQCSHVQIASLSELLESQNCLKGTLKLELSVYISGVTLTLAFAEFPKSTH